METTDAFADVLEAAQRHAEALGGTDLTAPPRRNLAIVTCMDARIDPIKLFGLDIGDAHVMRNAGARVTEDVTRSLLVSTAVLGVNRIVVIHHTDCGAHGTTNEALRDKVRAASGHDPDTVDFLAFDDQIATLKGDVARLANESCLPAGTSIAGFVYDVHSGQLTRHTPTVRVGESE